MVSFSNILYVDASMFDNSHDGSSWAKAKRTIQAAIDVSSVNDTILVKYGTYNISSQILISSDRKIISDDGHKKLFRRCPCFYVVEIGCGLFVYFTFGQPFFNFW